MELTTYSAGFTYLMNKKRDTTDNIRGIPLLRLIVYR